MKNFVKNSAIAVCVLVCMLTFVVTFVLSIRYINAIDNTGASVVMSKYCIVALVCVIINFIIMCANWGVLFDNRDTKQVNVWQNIVFGISLVTLIVVIATYVITNTTSNTALYDLINSTNANINNTEEIFEMVSVMEVLLQNNIIIFAIINAVSTVLLGALFYKKDCKEKVIAVDKKLDDVQKVDVPELSQNDMMKKEIEELKKQLEMEDLKEEYAKLYKELQKKKDK